MTDQTSDTVGRLNAALEGRYRIDRELGELQLVVNWFQELTARTDG